MARERRKLVHQQRLRSVVQSVLLQVYQGMVAAAKERPDDPIGVLLFNVLLPVPLRVHLKTDVLQNFLRHTS